MDMKYLFILTISLLSLINSRCLLAQDVETGSESSGDNLFVFLDCNARNCDFDHFRRTIPWVNWVRDRTLSEIHLLITSQGTAAGGLQYTLDFIGRESLEGMKKSHVFRTDPNATDTEARNQLANMIALGLIEFVQDKPEIISRLSVSYEPSDDEEVVNEDQENDPWNLWVFRVGVNGGIEGEAQQRQKSLGGFASARRVDEDFKFELYFDGEYEHEEFDDIEDGDTFINISEDYSTEVLAVWSLTPHSSFGGLAELSKSTFVNREFGLEAGPAYEYNIFPYSESTRRFLTITYAAGIATYNYELETVQGKTDDFFGLHMLQLSAEIQQPWGEIDAFVEGIQYFTGYSTPHPPFRINTFLRLEYRLFRGFEIFVFGRYSSINDQFYLPIEGLSPEEILLRRRQRETDFSFDLGVGLSYRFGSKFANIVNPRMD